MQTLYLVGISDIAEPGTFQRINIDVPLDVIIVEEVFLIDLETPYDYATTDPSFVTFSARVNSAVVAEHVLTSTLNILGVLDKIAETDEEGHWHYSRDDPDMVAFLPNQADAYFSQRNVVRRRHSAGSDYYVELVGNPYGESGAYSSGGGFLFYMAKALVMC